MSNSSTVIARIVTLLTVIALTCCDNQPNNMAEQPDSRIRGAAATFNAAEYERFIASDFTDEAHSQSGAVKLPTSSSNLSADGNVYVTQGHSWGDLYLFLTWRGKGSNLRGYLYCQPSSGVMLPGGHTTIEIIAPAIYTPEGYGPVEVEAKKLPEPGWYFVSRSLD